LLERLFIDAKGPYGGDKPLASFFEIFRSQVALSLGSQTQMPMAYILEPIDSKGSTSSRGDGPSLL